ncbi:MAG: hypothetical protein QW158_05220 [Nitrososphaerales archaeon]
MEAKSKDNEVSKMLNEIKLQLQSDMDAIKDELKKEGYNVLAIYPKDVSLTKKLGRLGFSLTISEDKAKELSKILRRDLRGTLSIEFGLHKNLAVFVVIVKYPTTHQALLYPVYYHTDVEWLIKELGKQGLFTFFKEEKTEDLGWLSMGNHQLYLYSRYPKAKHL